LAPLDQFSARPVTEGITRVTTNDAERLPSLRTVGALMLIACSAAKEIHQSLSPDGGLTLRIEMRRDDPAAVADVASAFLVPTGAPEASKRLIFEGYRMANFHARWLDDHVIQLLYGAGYVSTCDPHPVLKASDNVEHPRSHHALVLSIVPVPGHRTRIIAFPKNRPSQMTAATPRSVESVKGVPNGRAQELTNCRHARRTTPHRRNELIGYDNMCKP
jgi:hypothetical protein